MNISGETRVFALLGRPVHHSQSPRLHNRWFSALHMDARYVALDVPPERGHHVPDALRSLGLAGANLTVPLKHVVLPHLDALAPSARLAGAANVIVRSGEGLVGHNTDGSGLMEYLKTLPIDWNRPAVVLGAGGAGRAVVTALVAAGLPAVHLLNRTVATADAIAALHGTGVIPGALEPDCFSQRAPGVGLVVQATSGPGRTTIASLPVDRLSPGTLWVDLNYWDPNPPLRARLEALGIRFDDGWGMLVAQAAQAFTLFTGHNLPLHQALSLMGPR